MCWVVCTGVSVCCSLKPSVLTASAHYEQVMSAFGGRGYLAETRQQVRDALMSCLADTQTTSLINILINPTTGKKPQVIYHIVLILQLQKC